MDSMVYGVTIEEPHGNSTRDFAFLSTKHSLLLSLFQWSVFL